MAKHSIVGAGNLGIDLYIKLKEQGHEVTLYSRRQPEGILEEDFVSFSYPTQSPRQVMSKADVIWCTLGCGSVEHAEEHFAQQLDAHVRLPLHLIQTFREAKIVLFSTDYLCGQAEGRAQYEEPKSLYAKGKLMMELLAKQAGGSRVAIFRVGSLYGLHKPESTFPGKILLNRSDVLQVPVNEVLPTPTDWLAEECIERFKSVLLLRTFFHASPSGRLSLKDWASFITPKKVSGWVLDSMRPASICDLNDSDFEDALVMWRERRAQFLKAMFDRGLITEDNYPREAPPSPNASLPPKRERP